MRNKSEHTSSTSRLSSQSLVENVGTKNNQEKTLHTFVFDFIIKVIEEIVENFGVVLFKKTLKLSSGNIL